MECRFIPSKLSDNLLDKNFVEQWVTGVLYEKDTHFVYGVGVLKGRLHVLIDPRSEYLPSWYPAVIFSFTNRDLPDNWVIQNEYAAVGWEVIIGYSALVSEPSHFDGILTREPDELLKFKKIALSYFKEEQE